MKSLNIDKALSVSCGDGIWDYLVFHHNKNISYIIATDIVECPVSKSDQLLLKDLGVNSNWNFTKVDVSGILPFEDNDFDFVFHQDVVEHTDKPYTFLKEQYRVLKKGGVLLCGTPNLFRPANLMKLITGHLRFPLKIGYNKQIGDYIHVQEFYEQQLKLILAEIGFKDIQVKHCFFGFHFANICFSKYPTSDLGKTLSHFLVFTGKK